MSETLKDLKPVAIWKYFEEICEVPRPSKKEEKIIEYLRKFAEVKGLEHKVDEAGNVLIKAPASTGMEHKPIVVLQSHLDMVGEKLPEIQHDFDSDPITPYIDGDWVKAKGTTLGADCGIGIAASLAVLTDESLRHGPVECLFTVDEETGLTGAAALEQGFFDGKILLNLDSEDEGELFIGCAGGIDTLATFNVKREPVPGGFFAIELEVGGLLGGHSGDDIHKGRANAIKILVRFLHGAMEKYGVRLVSIQGGNLRNAIARNASATIVVRNAYKENLVADFNVFKSEIKQEVEKTEPNIKLGLGSTEFPDNVIKEDDGLRLIKALFVCPHGIHTMSFRMPGMVETSTNLASIKEIKPGQFLVTSSQRSDIESGKNEIASMVATVFEMSGASVKHSDGYPGWSPNPDSPILKVTASAYEELFGKKTVVRTVHAGLECGLFLEKYPDLDMVSFGPTILGAHSPDERISIETVQKFWKHLVLVLEKV